MPRRDTLDKVVGTYFAAITRQPILWRGETLPAMPLRINGGMLRGFTCPAVCGGCCPTFSLDYLPEDIEPHPYPLTPRTVQIDDREVTVWSDEQEENKGSRCKNLDPDDGRCGIHGRQPFSCDFELLRFSRHADHYTLNERLFGRGWNMRRVDGERGALCSITPATSETASDVLRRIKRLAIWADYFGLDHKAHEVAQYVRTFRHDPDSAPAVSL